MAIVEETVATLAATLVSVQKNQDEMREFNMNSFKRIMERLDSLPSMQRDIAVIQEKMQNLTDKIAEHIKQDDFIHAAQNKEVDQLKKDNWIRHGATIAVGGIVGFFASLLHRG